MHPVVYILFGWAFTVTAACALGSLLLHALKLRRDLFLSFVAGSAVLSLLVFLLSAVQLARKGVFLAVGIAAIAAGARRIPIARPRLHWSLAPFAAYAVLYFVNALAPEHSPDGVTYHLGLVSRYYRERGFFQDVPSMYSVLSQGAEMLFLFAYAFGRHSAAAMVHFTFLLALPAGMYLWARDFTKPAIGAVAAILVFASPVAGVTGISAYNDIAAACVLVALFLTLENWRRDRERSMLVLAGLLAGFAYAVKYTAGIAVIYALGYVLWYSRRWRPAALVCVCAAVSVLPWMTKNVVTARNPVAPFLSELFPNPHYDPELEHEYTSYMREFNDVKLSEVWREVTVSGWRLGGLLGPVFLLTPLALAAASRPEGLRLLIPAALFLLPYFANTSTRFLLPSLPFWALALACVLMRFPPAALAIAGLHALLSWPGMILLYSHPHAWQIREAPWRAALRLQSEEEYLTYWERGYLVARTVERFVPPGERVFAFSTYIAEAYTTRNVIVAFQSSLGRRLRDILYAPVSDLHRPDHALEWKFPARQVRRVRAVQTAMHDSEDWSITEFRVYSGGQELSRPGWRLRATVNPWQVQDAFDNSYVTRWKSLEPNRPGMFVEVDFGSNASVDAVRLEGVPDQWHSRPALETSSGEDWIRVASEPERQPFHPPGDLRKAASEELKRMGVRYVLVDDADYFASDFSGLTARWGWTLLAERSGARLYRVD